MRGYDSSRGLQRLSFEQKIVARHRSKRGLEYVYMHAYSHVAQSIEERVDFREMSSGGACRAF